MPKMIEISAAEYERLQDCIREDGLRIAALIEENKALHQEAKRLTAAQKAKRELTANKGGGQRYEAEIALLKQMAAEDILLAAQSRCPCNSCTENPIDKGCAFEECEGCDHRCVCYECNDDESFVWRGSRNEQTDDKLP